MPAREIPAGEEPTTWVAASDFVRAPTFPAWIDRGSALVRVTGVPPQTTDGVVLLIVETIDVGPEAEPGPIPIDPAARVGVR